MDAETVFVTTADAATVSRLAESTATLSVASESCTGQGAVIAAAVDWTALAVTVFEMEAETVFVTTAEAATVSRLAESTSAPSVLSEILTGHGAVSGAAVDWIALAEPMTFVPASKATEPAEMLAETVLVTMVEDEVAETTSGEPDTPRMFPSVSAITR